MEQNSIGEKIKGLRSRAGLSQDELAEGSGLSLRSIQRIENDKTVPRGDSLKRIAKALNVSIEVFTSEQEKSYSTAVAPMKEDPKIPLILILSALTFLIYPVLGIICPAILWLLYKNTNSGVQEVGLKIIRLQLIWCAILAFVYLYIFSKKVLHLDLPVPGNNKLAIVFILAMYIVNVFVICSVLFTWMRKSKTLQKA